MKLAAWSLFGLLALNGPVHAELRNQLSGAPSPYLTMHAEDPVAWQTWGSEVLERARREGKLVFVSSGYFSCHWCHVMQRESYADPQIAALLNRYFIPVKIDRELDPALDARLIDFVERTRGHSGWPLNAFITPAGYPLVGMVYLPPDEFRALLQRLAARWERERPELEELAAAATAELQPAVPASGPPPVNARTRARDALLEATWQLADEFEGGFGQQTKFPSVPQLAVLLELQEHSPEPRLEAFLRLTLDRMADGGLRDHLGGGFFRYVVDPGWRLPHFEKMLYDNALLAELYLEAGRVFGDPAYTRVGLDTLEFMLREFSAPGGGFIASLSAVDASGEEGAYYLWEEAELRELLDPELYRLAAVLWGLAGPAEHEAGYHLVRKIGVEEAAAELGRSRDTVLSQAGRIRAILRAARAQRALPRDTKRVAAWNGLVLSALVAGARAAPEAPRWREAAGALRDFIVGELWTGEDLLRTPEKAGGRVALEDYAYVARGLWHWAEFAQSSQDRQLAVRLVNGGWRRFYDQAGGWRLDESILLKYGLNGAPAADGPMPSPSAVLVRLSLSLGERLNLPPLVRRAEAALHSDAAEVLAEPFWHATGVTAVIKTERARPPEH